jgi:sporulation protein YlmC with PRC-barrel domain
MQDMQQHQQRAPEADPGAPTADQIPGDAGTVQDRATGPRSFQSDTSGSDHPLIPAKRVNGSAVYNQAGEQIGRVEDIAIDKRSGKVAYAILSFGGFIGLGEKHQPLPWSALNSDPRLGGYKVEVTEEFLRLAPKLDTAELSGWDDSDQRQALHDYYAPAGARPYW